MELYNSLVDRLNNQHLCISEIIKNLDANSLTTKPSAEKWSIHENLAHITSYHHVLLQRLNKILKEENPFFPRYNPDSDPELTKWLDFNVAELLKHLADNRISMNTFILNLTPKELNRTGTHKKFGTMNIVEWIEFFLLHEAHHIYTIFKISRQLKA